MAEKVTACTEVDVYRPLYGMRSLDAPSMRTLSSDSVLLLETIYTEMLRLSLWRRFSSMSASSSCSMADSKMRTEIDWAALGLQRKLKPA